MERQWSSRGSRAVEEGERSERQEIPETYEFRVGAGGGGGAVYGATAHERTHDVVRSALVNSGVNSVRSGVSSGVAAILLPCNYKDLTLAPSINILHSKWTGGAS